MVSYKIRNGRIDDCEDVVRLMQKLSAHEGFAGQTKITPDDLRRDGFGPDPVFQCAVLEKLCDDGVSVLVGYALYFYGFCSWNGRMLYFEDLFVEREYRGMGLGVALMHKVIKMAVDRGCNCIQACVVEWNTEVRQLYRHLGIEDLTETKKYHLLSFTGEKLDKFVKKESFISKDMILKADL
ncbi:thialysine N-epsilon-acetyltransferase-like [Lytechinus variegatus]|uniref:thialysine N-epsilon-acetyltransferase-like n=2 Tax=Lytechinus TaxID=7652 RepID=UPI001BB2C262|nr:thialysine N-epsilon-acetyltransferase-like [Lytechinus variegatus]